MILLLFLQLFYLFIYSVLCFPTVKCKVFVDLSSFSYASICFLNVSLFSPSFLLYTNIFHCICCCFLYLIIPCTCYSYRIFFLCLCFVNLLVYSFIWHMINISIPPQLFRISFLLVLAFNSLPCSYIFFLNILLHFSFI